MNQNIKSPGICDRELGSHSDTLGIAFEPIGEICNCATFHLLIRALTRALHDNAIVGEISGLFRPSYAVLLVDLVAWRKALPVITDFAKENGFCGFSQVARWDRDELVWRPLYGGDLPFSRFLAPEEVAAARAAANVRAEAFKIAASKMGRQND